MFYSFFNYYKLKIESKKYRSIIFIPATYFRICKDGFKARFFIIELGTVIIHGLKHDRGADLNCGY
jgi:hypothetical protein